MTRNERSLREVCPDVSQVDGCRRQVIDQTITQCDASRLLPGMMFVTPYYGYFGHSIRTNPVY
ncbi:MAG: hypothetical protein WBG39_11420, partial [Gordonia sp. (in: high G+C Gram-positive bacteria)]